VSGAMSGTGTVTLSSNNSSVIIFSSANTYTGATNITGTGGAGAGSSAVILKLGALNTIASSSSVNLAGGMLDPDALTQAMGSTTLNLSTSTAVSTID